MPIELLLCNVSDKANVGSCYRLAYQFDISKIWRWRCARPGYTNTHKTERHIPCVDIEDLSILESKDYKLKIAIEEGGSTILPHICGEHITRKDLILYSVGNEGDGFPKTILEKFDYIYTLRTVKKGSYNVSVALALALYNCEL